LGSFTFGSVLGFPLPSGSTGFLGFVVVVLPEGLSTFLPPSVTGAGFFFPGFGFRDGLGVLLLGLILAGLLGTLILSSAPGIGFFFPGFGLGVGLGVRLLGLLLAGDLGTFFLSSGLGTGFFLPGFGLGGGLGDLLLGLAAGFLAGDFLTGLEGFAGAFLETGLVVVFDGLLDTLEAFLGGILMNQLVSGSNSFI